MKSKKPNPSPVIVKLLHDPGAEQTKNLRVYVVDTGGKVIEHAAFEGAEARLKLSKEMLEGKAKVYIAPNLGDRVSGKKITERTLLKANAYEAVKNFNDNILSVYRIPPGILIPFPYYNCLITGHINKYFFINGQWTNLPLCDMRVHICEVETELVWPYIPIYYRRIPDWVIVEIGQKIIDLHTVTVVRPPIPIPDPIGPVSNKINLPLRSLSLKNTNAQNAVKINSAANAARVNSPAKLPENVLSAMGSGSIDIIRQTMIDYHDLIYPYLCFWPIYWPWIYTCDEETIVTTDCNGHFEMWENTFSEDGLLNIYIWIEAYIGGTWVTVYNPPLPCNTWWDYSCGSDINITITDPRVEPCHCGVGGPGDAFWFRSIGSSAGALHIEQNLAHTQLVQSTNFPNVGCTDALGISDYISPFGGSLSLQVFAGENIYSSGSGVTHFRWKATRIYDENLNWIPSGFQTTSILNADGKVYREYVVKFGTFTYLSFNLEIAPDGTGNNVAFRIPNQDIMLEPTIVAAYPGHEIFWRDIFWTSATVDSSGFPMATGNGLYRFDLELGTYSGSNFVVTDVDPRTFQISQSGDLDSSQDPTAPYLNMIGPLAHNYTMLVRIDNAQCTAHIHDAQLETGALSGPCGFIKYTDVNQDVLLSFEASHPRNFASFSYNVYKGNHTQDTGIHPAGYVFSTVSPFTLAAGLFSDNFTVNDLLNGCPGQAAFSENLYVAALATNGSARLYGYDASDVNAFALSNT
jgi:hypothetical protein